MSTSTSSKTPLGLRNPIHNPFPSSLSSQCIKAARIIDSFINPLIVGDGGIPRKILGRAKVLIICTVARVGCCGTLRFGSGIMVSRLPDGNWSAPSAVALSGVGCGMTFGVELTDYVFAMSTDEAVAKVMHMPGVSLGLNVSLALGLGRTAESGTIFGMRGASGFYSFSKTRGVYAGLSGEVSIVVENPSANKKIYERKLKARHLVGGGDPVSSRGGAAYARAEFGCYATAVVEYDGQHGSGGVEGPRCVLSGAQADCGAG
ncbi:hypothetical protein N7468_004564 [Penicillium chermesinum]|uniref:Ysc84 actin-binding domain-containing protein n=1 Tax=Penicillium chermesinum TaxID=63820 RepID=A0A9W9P8R9_9EURO|nr:uncharacterized protein N7468_004564 [Penicillium chermesinum]KAJ5239945.1 hypothetical protein N7468_004564 [Penicillium chermesinum]